MNKVILMGRLTADPELRQTQSGVSSCRFTVAVNRRFKNDKGEYEADFVSCVAWRQTAEFVSKYFSKGQMIALEGTLRTGSYTDRDHPDVTHYTTEVYVDNTEFCGSKNESGTTVGADPCVRPTDNNTSNETVSLSDFEEILSDGSVPF